MEPQPRTLVSSDPPDARGLRVGVVTSFYHAEITAALEAGATEVFVESGGVAADLIRAVAPGAFELVPIAAALAARSDVHAVVALGCIVRGETRHDRWLAQSISNALAALAASHAKPVAFGVLTVERLRQARERAGGGKGHKGREAMEAALRAARAIEAVRR